MFIYSVQVSREEDVLDVSLVLLGSPELWPHSEEGVSTLTMAPSAHSLEVRTVKKKGATEIFCRRKRMQNQEMS